MKYPVRRSGDRSDPDRVRTPGGVRGAHRLARGWLLLAGMLTVTIGCSPPGTVAIPKISPESMSEQALAEYDANKDGALDAKELEKCPGLKSILKTIDTNK